MRNILFKAALSTIALAPVALTANPAFADGKADQHADGSKTSETGTQEPEAGEAELAKMLEGYVAGEPVRCLARHRSDRMRVIDDTALVFRSGGTIYVNRTSAPEFIDDFDVPVFRSFGGDLCRLDRVEFVDRVGGIGGPVALLEDFIPYRKAKTAS